MKTWYIKYSYCRVGAMIWQGGPLWEAELILDATSYETARIDLRGKLNKEGYNLYRFIAKELYQDNNENVQQ